MFNWMFNYNGQWYGPFPTQQAANDWMFKEFQETGLRLVTLEIPWEHKK